MSEEDQVFKGILKHCPAEKTDAALSQSSVLCSLQIVVEAEQLQVAGEVQYHWQI